MKRSKLETLLLTLESTPALLVRAASALTPQQARTKPEEGSFSFLENVWHLADLEREGYEARIRRILAEEEPLLPDFDGDRIARERSYNERDLEEGLAAFIQARARNVEALRRAGSGDWRRRAIQECVGRIALEDVPRQMSGHDADHIQDVRGLLAYLLEGRPYEKQPASAVA